MGTLTMENTETATGLSTACELRDDQVTTEASKTLPSLKLDLSEINLSEAARFIRNYLCSGYCVKDVHWLVEVDAPKSLKPDARRLVRSKRRRLKEAAVTIQRIVKGYLLRKTWEFKKLKEKVRIIEAAVLHFMGESLREQAMKMQKQNSYDDDQNEETWECSIREGFAGVIQQWWRQQLSFSKRSFENETEPLFHTSSNTGSHCNSVPTERLELESVHSQRSSDPAGAYENSSVASSPCKGEIYSEQQNQRKQTICRSGPEDSRPTSFVNIREVIASRANAAKQALVKGTPETSEQIRERQRKVEEMEKERLEEVRKKAKQRAEKKAKESVTEKQKEQFNAVMKELRRWHQSRREKAWLKERRKRAERLRKSRQKEEEQEIQKEMVDKERLREEMHTLVRQARVALRNRLQRHTAQEENRGPSSRHSSANSEETRNAQDHLRIAAARQANQQSAGRNRKQSKKRKRVSKGAHREVHAEEELLFSWPKFSSPGVTGKQPKSPTGSCWRQDSPSWIGRTAPLSSELRETDEASEDSDVDCYNSAMVRITTPSLDQRSDHDEEEYETSANYSNLGSSKPNPIMTETPVELEHLNYRLKDVGSGNPARVVQELANHHSSNHHHRRNQKHKKHNQGFVSYDGIAVSSVEELLQRKKGRGGRWGGQQKSSRTVRIVPDEPAQSQNPRDDNQGNQTNEEAPKSQITQPAKKVGSVVGKVESPKTPATSLASTPRDTTSNDGYKIVKDEFGRDRKVPINDVGGSTDAPSKHVDNSSANGGRSRPSESSHQRSSRSRSPRKTTGNDRSRSRTSRSPSRGESGELRSRRASRNRSPINKRHSPPPQDEGTHRYDTHKSSYRSERRSEYGYRTSHAGSALGSGYAAARQEDASHSDRRKRSRSRSPHRRQTEEQRTRSSRNRRSRSNASSERSRSRSPRRRPLSRSRSPSRNRRLSEGPLRRQHRRQEAQDNANTSHPFEQQYASAELQRRREPFPFEMDTQRQVYKLDSGTGFFFDPSRRFYYDARAKLYLDAVTGDYMCADANGYFQYWVPPLPLVPPPPPPPPALYPAAETATSSTEAFTTGETNIQQSIGEKTEVFCQANTSKETKESRPTEEKVAPTAESNLQHICFICRRGFTTKQQLEKHERKSKLHKENLEKLKQSGSHTGTVTSETTITPATTSNTSDKSG